MVLDSGIGNMIPGRWVARHIVLHRGRVTGVVSPACQGAPNVAMQANLVSVLPRLEGGQQLPDDHSFDSVEDCQGSQSVTEMIDGADSLRPILAVQQEESYFVFAAGDFYFALVEDSYFALLVEDLDSAQAVEDSAFSQDAEGIFLSPVAVLVVVLISTLHESISQHHFLEYFSFVYSPNSRSTWKVW